MIEVQTRDQEIAGPEEKIGGVEARAVRAAEQIGVQTADIERLPFDLSALLEDGIFINVDAQGFGMLDRRLDWQALGITLPRPIDVAFRPPRCGLVPDRYRLPLLRPSVRAHTALHKYSYTFHLTEALFEGPSYRWVPWRAFEAFEAEFEQARAALDEAKTRVLDRYEAVQAEIVETFRHLARDSTCRLEATGQHVPMGFEQAVVQGVLAAMPSPQEVRDKLILRYRVGVMLLGSEMLAEQRKAQEERSRLEQVEATRQLERQRQEAQERLLQQELWAEEERIRQRLRVEEEERRREAEVKERLRRLKLEAAKERLQETMSPLEEGAKQLHTALYEAASAIRTSLQQRHYLHGSSAKRARELSRWFSLMQWQSDEQLETLVAELERLASRPNRKRKRDLGSIDQVLGDIIELCYADARELAEPHRMGALEL